MPGIINLSHPLEKPVERVTIPNACYLFKVSDIENGLTRDKTKQLLKVKFAVADGQYSGVIFKQAFSIGDDFGRQRFAQLYMAIKGATSLDAPVLTVNPDEMIDKLVYIDIVTVERDYTAKDGSQKKIFVNDCKEGINPFSPYEPGKPAPEPAPTPSATSTKPATTSAAPPPAATPPAETATADTDEWN